MFQYRREHLFITIRTRVLAAPVRVESTNFDKMLSLLTYEVGVNLNGCDPFPLSMFTWVTARNLYIIQLIMNAQVYWKINRKQ